MCGIAGYFGRAAISQNRLEACLGLLKRRGPDHRALRRWTNACGRNVYLLHGRLNIIDLDPRSNQPFQEGSQWLAYNGEIYNYLELKESLERSGERFRTSSDTEILARLLRRSGPEALESCEGMWAFAAYDEANGSLLLSRDRFGEKPLYLYRDTDGIYFGSEVKFIAALLGRRLPINVNQLCRYLVNGYKSLYKTGETFFQGLSELPSGSWMRISPQGDEDLRHYWTPAFRPDDSMSYEEAVSGARDRVIESVRLRLRADVPLAFCMSGGVDSNSLISVAKRVFNYDVHGFTIANTDERYEEQGLVETSAKELGIRHTSVPVDTRNFLQKMRELVRQHDAPVYTITYYAHWLLMEAVAARGYRISVSGTAADELFSGYYDHYLAYLFDIREEPELLAASREAWSQHIKPIVRNPFLSDPDTFLRDRDFRAHIYLNAEEFSACLKAPWSEPFQEKRFTASLLRNRMLNELFHEATPVVLHEDDLNAMYFSIENRSPFLDRSLFDFCYRIPSRHLVRDGRAKSVLRDAMRGIVPAPILGNRRKVGFNAPIFSFLDPRDPAVRRELFRDSPIFDHLKRDRIIQLLDKETLPNSESKFLFYFLSSKLFLEEFS